MCQHVTKSLSWLATYLRPETALLVLLRRSRNIIVNQHQSVSRLTNGFSLTSKAREMIVFRIETGQHPHSITYNDADQSSRTEFEKILQHCENELASLAMEKFEGGDNGTLGPP